MAQATCLVSGLSRYNQASISLRCGKLAALPPDVRKWLCPSVSCGSLIGLCPTVGAPKIGQTEPERALESHIPLVWQGDELLGFESDRILWRKPTGRA
jgi:hypothetical protein